MNPSQNWDWIVPSTQAGAGVAVGVNVIRGVAEGSEVGELGRGGIVGANGVAVAYAFGVGVTHSVRLVTCLPSGQLKRFGESERQPARMQESNIAIINLECALSMLDSGNSSYNYCFNRSVSGFFLAFLCVFFNCPVRNRSKQAESDKCRKHENFREYRPDVKPPDKRFGNGILNKGHREYLADDIERGWQRL